MQHCGYAEIGDAAPLLQWQMSKTAMLGTAGNLNHRPVVIDEPRQPPIPSSAEQQGLNLI